MRRNYVWCSKNEKIFFNGVHTIHLQFSELMFIHFHLPGVAILTTKISVTHVQYRAACEFHGQRRPHCLLKLASSSYEGKDYFCSACCLALLLVYNTSDSSEGTGEGRLTRTGMQSTIWLREKFLWTRDPHQRNQRCCSRLFLWVRRLFYSHLFPLSFHCYGYVFFMSNTRCVLSCVNLPQIDPTLAE